jgi:NAD(P)-dependent dehydrogenase (short-subunit alcohol dehydrogenase family)
MRDIHLNCQVGDLRDPYRAFKEDGNQAYDVDVVGAIVVTQVAAPAMRAAGGGTILFTGGGWADHRGEHLGHSVTRAEPDAVRYRRLCQRRGCSSGGDPGSGQLG